MSTSEKFTEYQYDKVTVLENHSDKHGVPKYGFGIRHVQLVIFFSCLTVNYIARGHMGVTIVAMTSIHKESIENIHRTMHIGRQNDTNDVEDTLNFVKQDNEDIVSTLEPVQNISSVNSEKSIYWPKSTQEMVLSSFYVGYCIMMFPIGMVCQKWGGKLPLQLALFCNALASISTPWLTTWGGWKATCFCRMVQGLAQAGTYPSLQTLLSKWVPASERATLSSYVYTGTSLGNVIAFQLGGYLGDSRWGWPSTFWTVGGISFSCFLLLTVFGAATPLEHKTISEEEKEFILGKDGDRSIRKPKTPWRAIIKSKPLWGTTITHVGSTIGFVFLFQQASSYIHYILGTNVKNSGFLTSLPYIVSLFFSFSFGPISDYCTNNNIVSLRNARRISNSISQFGMAFSLLCVSYTTNITVAMACLVIAMSANSAVHTGWMVNHIDLAPNFSGTLMAIGNTLANFFIVLLPILVSHIITDMTNVTQWRIMFFIIAGICLITNAVFVILMSSDTQPWNFVEDNETRVKEQKLETNKVMEEKQ